MDDVQFQRCIFQEKEVILQSAIELASTVELSAKDMSRMHCKNKQSSATSLTAKAKKQDSTHQVSSLNSVSVPQASSDSDDDSCYPLFSVLAQRKPITLSVRIQDSRQRVADGATMSIIGEPTYCSLFSDVRLEDTDITLVCTMARSCQC